MDLDPENMVSDDSFTAGAVDILVKVEHIQIALVAHLRHATHELLQDGAILFQLERAVELHLAEMMSNEALSILVAGTSKFCNTSASVEDIAILRSSNKLARLSSSLMISSAVKAANCGSKLPAETWAFNWTWHPTSFAKAASQTGVRSGKHAFSMIVLKTLQQRAPPRATCTRLSKSHCSSY